MVELNPDKDGITHINVYSKGKTELGRFLTNFAHTPFEHPEFGHFESMEAYWYWTLLDINGVNADQIRNTSGYKAKELGRKLRIDIDRNIENGRLFKDRILDGIKCKLRSHREWWPSIKESTLPFTHYYYYGKNGDYKIYNMSQYQWMLDEFDRIRKILQDG